MGSAVSQVGLGLVFLANVWALGLWAIPRLGRLAAAPVRQSRTCALTRVGGLDGAGE